MYTTFANGSAKEPEALTLDKLLAMHKATKELVSKPPLWLVMDPHGTVHVGTVEQMLSLLVSAHPITAFTPIQEQSL